MNQPISLEQRQAAADMFIELKEAVINIIQNVFVIIAWIFWRIIAFAGIIHELSTIYLKRPLEILLHLAKQFQELQIPPYVAAILCVVLTLLYRRLFSRKGDRTLKYRASLKSCRDDLIKKMERLNCHPLMLRLAWSDACTYDRSIKSWPACGGCNGHIRFSEEINHPNNAGLSNAIEILKPLKKAYPLISWADLIQMAGAAAVETLGGPKIQMVYGRCDSKASLKRKDALVTRSTKGVASARASMHASKSSRAEAASSSESEGDSDDDNESRGDNEFVGRVGEGCPYDRGAGVCLAARQPKAMPPYPDGAPTADIHIRNTLYRMGFSNRDIVALLGAHTIGRAFHDRSGVCPHKSGDQEGTNYTRITDTAKGKPASYLPGGCSWTKNWLVFDNSYFRRLVKRINMLSSTKRKFISSSSITASPLQTNPNRLPARILFPNDSPANSTPHNKSSSNNGNSNYNNSSSNRNGSSNSFNSSSGILTIEKSNPDNILTADAQLRSNSSGINSPTLSLDISDKVREQVKEEEKEEEIDEDLEEEIEEDDDVDDPTELLWLPIDHCLIESPEFVRYVLLYGSRSSKSQALFFSDYSASHKRMSELGCLLDPPGGILID